MHQPLEDYIPPFGTQLGFMAVGAFFGFLWGDGVGGGAFFGILAAGLLGVPLGLVASYIYHYVALAPVRADDKRRYEENKVRYAEEAREKAEAFRARQEESRKFWADIKERREARMEREIAAGKMLPKHMTYLKRKAEEAAKKAEAL